MTRQTFIVGIPATPYAPEEQHNSIEFLLAMTTVLNNDSDALQVVVHQDGKEPRVETVIQFQDRRTGNIYVVSKNAEDIGNTHSMLFINASHYDDAVNSELIDLGTGVTYAYLTPESEMEVREHLVFTGDLLIDKIEARVNKAHAAGKTFPFDKSYLRIRDEDFVGYGPIKIGYLLTRSAPENRQISVLTPHDLLKDQWTVKQYDLLEWSEISDL